MAGIIFNDKSSIFNCCNLHFYWKNTCVLIISFYFYVDIIESFLVYESNFLNSSTILSYFEFTISSFLFEYYNWMCNFPN